MATLAAQPALFTGLSEPVTEALPEVRRGSGLAPRRRIWSNGAIAAYAAVTAMTFSASGAAPTPLYAVYQQDFALAPTTLTVIFAGYAVALLAALLTVGSLSDYVGRKPVILAALAINVAAMILFATAGSAGALIVARSIQGFANGVALATLGATILDVDRVRGPTLNSVMAFVGLTAGNIAAGVLVTYAPWPTELVYLVLLALSGLEAAILFWIPETAIVRPGALASLVPRISVPAAARRALLLTAPANIAFWSLGGFYFSLMPSLFRVATGLTLPLFGGLVVAALSGSGAIAVLASRRIEPGRLFNASIAAIVVGVSLTLAGVHFGSVVLMGLGTLVSGQAFGAGFSATLRTVLPLATPDRRAGLLSAFYVQSYLAFSIPAVIAGFGVAAAGLRLTTGVYGAVVMGLAVLSLVAGRFEKRR